MAQATAARNIALYPKVVFFQNLVFWQAVWFLYFQNSLSAAEAILLYVVYDIATTVVEVPSGYMSDRLGRRITLIASAVCALCGTVLLALGGSFLAFAIAQVMIGSATAFSSGTGTSLLYESLVAEGREEEVEAQELKIWRYSFVALALSSVAGGAMALWLETAPFYAGAVTAAIMLLLTFRLAEPLRDRDSSPPLAAQWHSLKAALNKPVLRWLFALSTLMYVFSHLMYVFGQPFIFEALAARGYQNEAPLVSGGVSATMMLLSVAVSIFALRLRHWLGLPVILLCAFGLQIALIALLAVTNSIFAIALLFLRMVPSSLSTPFVMARIQGELSSDMRATYLSLQSLVGRIALAMTLYVASLNSSQVGQMAYSEIQGILVWYVLAGVVAIGTLVFAATRVRVEVERP